MKYNKIKSYDTYRVSYSSIHSLPENVRRDINLDDLFEKLDYTTSSVGRQYLYHLLCTDSPSEIVKHELFIQTLSTDTALREQLIRNIKTLNHPDAYSIVDILVEDEHTYPRNYLRLLQICRWLPLLCLILLLFSSTPALLFCLLLAAYIGNAILHFKEKNRLMGYYFSIPQLRKLLKLTNKLSKDSFFASIDDEAKELPKHLSDLQRKLTAFRFGIGLEGEAAMLVYLLTKLFNIFFLASTINIVYSFIAIKNKKQEIEKAFRFIGLLDTLCSLSFLRQSMPSWCFPSSPDATALHSTGLYHPLITDCVPNDITLSHKSMLITGSNMSGKTSFIRTVAINLLTAKTLNTCFANTFSIDLNRKIYSVIHTEDDLLEGKSYFFKEAENVKEALVKGKQGNYLLIFDELFKGTNTLERIAINSAVFSSLAKKNNLILASTHDIELTEALNDQYELYHFNETITDNTLTFDYKLKKGVVKEGNAIRILKLCDYPEEVIAKAEKEAKQMIEQKRVN